MPDEYFFGAKGMASGDKEDLIVSGTGEAAESGGGVGLSPVAATVAASLGMETKRTWGP
jgi:hypothetical protein